jgi:hypothetical protein
VETAAKGQIESAIVIWFLEGDVASIHSLAVAAQKLLHVAGTKIGKPSKNLTHIATWPDKTQKRWNRARNSFNHGPDRDFPKQSVSHSVAQGEIIMWDAVQCYLGVHDRLTPLMRLFAVRFTLENPRFINPAFSPGVFLNDIAVDDIGHLCRSEFLLECLLRNGPATRAKQADTAQD